MGCSLMFKLVLTASLTNLLLMTFTISSSSGYRAHRLRETNNVPRAAAGWQE
jgi:hypothetical protein